MDKRGNEIHTSETEASGGSKEGVVRWVLIIGTVLAIAALTLVWTTGAAVQDDGADSQTSVSNRQLEAQGSADDRGEPIAPAMGETGPAAAASPTAAATPGDAPAGDPRNDAE